MLQPLFWSAHVLPLQVGCTDIAILDLPFGPAAKKTPPLYRSRVPKVVGFMYVCMYVCTACSGVTQLTSSTCMYIVCMYGGIITTVIVYVCMYVLEYIHFDYL